jgi:YVTN family beta-propeller protein
VSVIDTSTDTVSDTVTVGANPIGVVVSPDGTRVYVADSGGDGTVSVITTSPTTNTVTATVPVGANAYGIAVSPDGARVYVTNNGLTTVAVIDTSTNTVTTVTGFISPTGVAVSPDGARVYVANNLSGTVSVIEGVTTPSAPSTDDGAPAQVKQPTLAETGPDLSLVLVGSGVSALLLFVGATAILASRRKLTGS